jgi:hypothetical protein
VTARSFLRTLVVLALAVNLAGSAAAQTRAELLREASAALDDFATERALDILRTAANPALGPTDAEWARGVQMLAQVLIEADRSALAGTWARWAVRVNPGLIVDSVNFLAGVVTAFREARTFAGPRTAGDAVTTTAWAWPQRGSTEAQGRILVEQGSMPVPVNVLVRGTGVVQAGQPLVLLPGSYDIEVGAAGYLPVRLSREVLPGVTTRLTFSLTSAALAADILPDAVRQRFQRQVAALAVRRYQSPVACAAGAFVSRDGLLLTSYTAIRGADAISGALPLEGQSLIEGVTVAAYDVAADLAVLRLPISRTDTLAVSPEIADGQSAWGMGFTDCRTPVETRVRITEWSGRPLGSLTLSDPLTRAVPGSPLADVLGRIAGVWSREALAAPGPRAIELLAEARRNAAQRQLLSVADVARREQHAFGTVVIATDQAGASARVTPLEPWHWRGLEAGGPVPLTLTGPMGRYHVVVTAGDLRREQDVTIRPGAQDQVVVTLAPIVAQVPVPGVQPQRRGRFPWLLAVLGAGGAAAAVVVLGGGGGGTVDPPSTGGILIRVPNP